MLSRVFFKCSRALRGNLTKEGVLHSPRYLASREKKLHYEIETQVSGINPAITYALLKFTSAWIIVITLEL